MTKELDWSRWLGPEAAPTLAEQMALVLRLSVPAILAEVSSTAMNYIDSTPRRPSAWWPAPPGSLAACASPW